MKIAVACGGTGGHIFPGLAVADVLSARGHHVTLWLAGRDVEQASIADWNGPVVRIKARGFSSRPGLGALGVVLRLIVAIFASVRRMRADRPDVLLAMGSYASVGPVIAARILRVPSVIHEGNAVPGRAVSFLARFASRVALGFQAAATHLNHPDLNVTGFPLRRMPAGDAAGWQLAEDRRTVLVMGGSQGAHMLNDTVSKALARLEQAGHGVNVIHLAGQRDAEEVRRRYRDAGVPARVFDFLLEMGTAYAKADVAISRAGAASCAELAFWRVPAVLVPLPTARRRHQLHNAAVVAASGGAELVEQSAFTIDRVCAILQSWCGDAPRLERMRKALARVAVPDAAEQLANLVEATPVYRRPR